jgi:hypothetical protein
MSVTLLRTTNDIFPQPRQDLLRHALTLDRLGHLGSNLARHATGHALKINVIAIGHVGHGGRSVDVCTVSSDGRDGWNHDLEHYVSI